jgi:hypothetical protein
MTMKIDMNKVEYRLGVSYQEALDAMNRTINGLYDVIEHLQQRVLLLEITESGDSD